MLKGSLNTSLFHICLMLNVYVRIVVLSPKNLWFFVYTNYFGQVSITTPVACWSKCDLKKYIIKPLTIYFEKIYPCFELEYIRTIAWFEIIVKFTLRKYIKFPYLNVIIIIRRALILTQAIKSSKPLKVKNELRLRSFFFFITFNQ